VCHSPRDEAQFQAVFQAVLQAVFRPSTAPWLSALWCRNEIARSGCDE
jgi:hypothetical protein